MLQAVEPTAHQLDSFAADRRTRGECAADAARSAARGHRSLDEGGQSEIEGALVCRRLRRRTQLAEDLALAGRPGVEAGRDREEVVHGVVAAVHVERRADQVRVDAGGRGQELGQLRPESLRSVLR